MNNLDFLLNMWKVKDQKSPINLPYKRWEIFAKLTKDMGFTVGAEIGVERGKFANHLLKNNPQLKLYGIDAWKTYKNYDGLPDISQERLSYYYKEARERLKSYNIQLVQDLSINAVKRFADESLDFVYIDANHRYEFVTEDIQAWSKKVKKGGMVAGHDYLDNPKEDINYGVKKAVDEWVKNYNIQYLFITKQDEFPTWFYIKT
jgi:hypothetical protein